MPSLFLNQFEPIKKTAHLILMFAFAFAFEFIAVQPTAASDFSRYPYWLPEWLWKGAPLSKLIDDSSRANLERKIDQVRQLPDDSSETSKLTNAAAMAASELFAARDLRWGADAISNTSTGRRLLVHLDPSFTDGMKSVLLEAVSKFLDIATDQNVIDEAFDHADDHPEPFPPEDIQDQGKMTPNPAFQNYLQSVLRPDSAASFASDMTEALTPSRKYTPILVIARYDGNPWWGGSYYDYYFDNVARLKRLVPQGFFYIRLNSDKMIKGQLRFDDSAFWASKISHELLHNLGYWHPGYADPEERDRYTQNSAPFIVGYERAILKNLDVRK